MKTRRRVTLQLLAWFSVVFRVKCWKVILNLLFHYLSQFTVHSYHIVLRQIKNAVLECPRIENNAFIGLQ